VSLVDCGECRTQGCIEICRKAIGKYPPNEGTDNMTATNVGEPSDIVARLRGGVFGLNRIALCEEAANEIERLRAALTSAPAQPEPPTDQLPELLSAALYMMEHQQEPRVSVFGKKILRSELKAWIRAALTAPKAQPAPLADAGAEPVAWRWSSTHYAHLPGLRKDWQDMPPPPGHRVAGEIEYAYPEALRAELDAAYLELRKHRSTIGAVFDRDVWDRAAAEK